MKINKILAIVFICVAFVGFLDAAYLTAQHYMGVVPPCFAVDGCDTVLRSEWSTIAGMPTSLWGALFYLVSLLLAIGYISSGKEKLFKGASLFTLLGFVTSIFLMGIQAFVLKHYCSYCLVSAATSTLLFIIGMLYLYKNRKPISLPEQA